MKYAEFAICSPVACWSVGTLFGEFNTRSGVTHALVAAELVLLEPELTPSAAVESGASSPSDDPHYFLFFLLFFCCKIKTLD